MPSPAGARKCPQCLEPMPAPASTGRPRKWCSDTCRERAKTEARADRSSSWGAVAGEFAEVPRDPLTRRRATLEALAEMLEGRPPAPPEDRLAEAIVEARQLAYTMRQLAPQVAPSIRARALGFAAAIGDALAKYWKEIA